MSSFLNQDEKWMAHALRLAENGRYLVSPNPMVGACLVKNGKLIGQGWHQAYGGPHAEIEVLRRAGRRAKGAVLYVTLEPCSSWGKTPPCTEAILASGVKRVVFADFDPNSRNHGKGASFFRQKGIQVTSGILAESSRKLNEAFYKFAEKRLPFVTLKMAQSLDGKIATSAGESKWISSEPARRFVQRLRAEQDAVLVGQKTLMADNPSLIPRCPLKKKQPEKPWRIVLDSDFNAPVRARIFKGQAITLVAVSEKKLKPISKRKNDRKTVLLSVPEKNGRLDLKALVSKLAVFGVSKLLVEGGGETAWSFLKAGLVDKIVWIIAPSIIGGRSAKSSVEGEGIKRLTQQFRVRDLTVSPLGRDWLFEGRL